MSVTYDQIIDILLLESGQFIADIESTLISRPKIELMIQRELGLYSRYLPVKTSHIAHLYNNKVFSVGQDGFVPKAIIDIRSDSSNVMGFAISPMPGPVHSYYWRYDKPTLYFRYPDGNYMMNCIQDHLYNPITGILDGIEIHDRFFNLLLGRFLQSIGKSRRAFTIDDIPISTDASDMISEGKEIYDTTLAEIRQNSAFNLAVLI